MTFSIKSFASKFALALPMLTCYIMAPLAYLLLSIVKLPSASRGVDVGRWTVGGTTLVLAANMDYASAQVDVTTLGLGTRVKIQQVVITLGKT